MGFFTVFFTQVEASPLEGVPRLQVSAEEEDEVGQRGKRSAEGEAGKRRGGLGRKQTDARRDC